MSMQVRPSLSSFQCWKSVEYVSPLILHIYNFDISITEYEKFTLRSFHNMKIAVFWEMSTKVTGDVCFQFESQNGSFAWVLHRIHAKDYHLAPSMGAKFFLFNSATKYFFKIFC